VIWVLLVMLLLLVFYGGFGYGQRERWGGYYASGLGLMAVVLVVLFIVWAVSGFAA
jgi:hypothetical protein